MKKNTPFKVSRSLLLWACMVFGLFSAQTVKAENGWQLVTDVTTLSVGDSIIIAAADHNMAIGTTQNTNNRAAVEINKSGNIATFTTSVQVFVLASGGQSGTFAIYDNDASGGYLYAAGGTSGNYLRTTSSLPTDGTGDWSISIASDGAATVVAQGGSSTTRCYMRYTNRSTLFAFYSSTSSITVLVTIYKYSELPTQAVETPTFSISGGLYTDAQQVSISCATTGATIYYTIDGTEPTSGGTLYTSPFTISTTTTLKAVAVVGTDTSLVNTATYTFPTPVANIAAFKATGTSTNTTPYLITGEVTYVYRNGSYMFVQDTTGGLLVYDNTSIITTTYNAGDVITGLTGTLTVYQNQYELVPLVNTAAATATATYSATTVTIADLIANYDQYDASLVTLQNVTLDADLSYSSNTTGSSVSISQNGSSIVIYNRFKTLDTTIANGTTLDITGFIGIYGSTIQIYPRDNSDLGAQTPTVPQPSLSILSPADNSIYSTLDTLSINVDIQNFVLGTDGLLKMESTLLTYYNMPNPTYFNATTWALIQSLVLSPLPEGTHTATLSLVDLNQQALTPAVTDTTTITVIAPQLAAPTIPITGQATGEPNTYYFTAGITMAASSGASIYYTTDGSTPDANGTLYTAPFDVTSATTIQAIAVQSNYANSDIATAYIIIDTPTVATPVFTPVTGTYADSVTFSLSCSTPNATIRYSTDGVAPTENSPIYSSPIPLYNTTTVMARAFVDNWHASNVETAVYTIAHDPALAVSVSTLNFSSTQLTQTVDVTTAFLSQAITLSCNDTHFTVTPSTMPANTTTFTATITFDGLAAATGILTISSDTLSAQVALTATALLSTPTITPATGTTDTAILVSMSCAQSDAGIYYTLDGSTPDATSTPYTAPFTLNTPGTYTVNAVAILTGWESSSIATATYTITTPVLPIVIADTLAYHTGFEPNEGYTPSNVYNNTTEAPFGPTQEWATLYGTVSTTSPICDSASMQMRWYTSAASTLGYTRTNFDVTHATRITFQAKSTNGLNAMVSYSTDGGNNYVDSIFVLTTNAQNYELIVSETAQYDQVRFKFAIVLPETTPTATSRLYIDSVSIYNFPSIISGTVEMPVISPNSATLYDTTSVSITCATQGADIYYTTDGSTPDANSTPYTTPFEVTTTTTVKAIAIKAGYNNSNVATATYTFPVEVSNIAAFKAANTATNTTVYKITGDVTFVYRDNRYIYIQDTTGGLLIYDNNTSIITNTYSEGDVISGGVCGTYTLYYGLVEMIPVRDMAATTSNSGTIVPAVTTVDDITTNYTQYESRLVKLEGVTFTDGGTFTTSSATNMDIEQNGTSMQVRNNFKTLDMTLDAGAQADVVGFVLRYNSNYQIAPRNNDDIILLLEQMDTVATPEITVDRLTNDMYAVSITCSTPDAVIYYTLDGSTPTTTSNEYTTTFTTEGGCTIKAIATKDGMSPSDIATYANVSVADYLSANVSIYPNPTSSRCNIAFNNGLIQTVMLYDTRGQLVHSETVNSHSATLDLSGLSAGNYFARLLTDHGELVKQIVVIR